MSEKNLSIAEKFLLIAHHPEKGRYVIPSTYLQYGLAGAILLDLTLSDLIETDGTKLSLKRSRPSTDPLLEEVAALISQSAAPRKAAYLIRKLGTRYSKYHLQLLKGLAGKRLLRIEEKKFLGLIPYRKSYLLESYTRSNLVRQLRNEIVAYRGVPGENFPLAVLVAACRLQRVVTTDRDELKQIRSQLKRMAKENPVSDAVTQTVSQVQAAVIASITAAVAASTSGRH
jgi:hypothetical protein